MKQLTRGRRIYPCSVETLQRRIAYGGRKGRSAARRIRSNWWLRNHSTDRESLMKFYKAVDNHAS